MLFLRRPSTAAAATAADDEGEVTEEGAAALEVATPERTRAPPPSLSDAILLGALRCVALCCAEARLQLELFKLGAPLPLLCLCLLWPPTAAPPRLAAHTLALLSHSKYHASGRALFMRLLTRGLVEALPRRPAAFLRTFHSESRTPTLVWTAAMREQLGTAVEAELASWEERGSSWAWEEFSVAYTDTEGLLQVDGVYLSLYIEQRPTLTSPRSFYAALLRALPPLVAKLPRRGEPPADLVRTVAAVTALIQLQPEVVWRRRRRHGAARRGAAVNPVAADGGGGRRTPRRDSRVFARARRRRRLRHDRRRRVHRG